MNHLRVAVIGGGHLGTIHARLVQQVQGVELVAIAESNLTRAGQLADEFLCPVVTDYRRLIRDGAIDAAVLAAPTSLHHDIGMLLLEQGIHTLIEKPLAASTAECQRLVATAEQAGCVLQVGHVERFNPAWTALSVRVGVPRFIDAVREGPLTFRCLDVGVVLDLMIHDIDLILSIVNARAISVQASGFAWTGSREDIAQARITFANGCVAHISASRVSCESARRMRLFGDDWHAHLDLGERSGYVVQGPSHRDWQSRSYSPDERKRLIDNLFDQVLPREILSVADGNPLLDELHDFVKAVRTSGQPRVTGRDGIAAVDVANQVIRQINQHVAPSLAPPIRKAG